MLVRDNANPFEGRDLGPRKTFQPSLMKPIAGYSEDRTGRWTGHSVHTFLTRPRRDVEHQPARTYSVSCERCGRSYQATQLTRARFCGATCRKAAHREAMRAPSLVHLREVPATT